MPKVTRSTTPTVASSTPKSPPQEPAPKNFEAQAIRTWTAGARGAAAPGALKTRGARDAELPSIEKFSGVTNAQLVSALSSADQIRLRDLKAGKTHAASLVTPEDGSATVKAIHMAALGVDQTGIEFPLAVARIGEAEGFNVVLRVPAGLEKQLEREFAKEKINNVTLVPIKNSEELDFWSEDQGELHVDGSVSVPRNLQNTDTLSNEDLMRVVTKGRLERLHPNAKADLSTLPKLSEVRRKYADVAYSNVGAVGLRGGQRAIAAVALGAKKELRVSNGYSEGGNALVGKRADGKAFAVVGVDSLVVTQAALSKELKRDVSNEEARALLAQDYGVDGKQLVIVEQPQDFHIDMHIALLPGGKAAVNDPMAVFELQKKWLTDDIKQGEPTKPPAGASRRATEKYQEEVEAFRALKEGLPAQLEKLKKDAEQAAAAMERTVKDLEKGGVEVHRVPGVFPGTDGLPRMNFLNAEQGRNAKGEHFMMLLGGDSRAEKVVAEKLADVSDEPLRVHFLDRSLTETTLAAMGGISCRAKIEAMPNSPRG